MSSTTERDSYGITVDGAYTRPIRPEKVVDVGRFDVTINGGGSVSGGILCRDLIVTEGPFSIEGAVMALGSARIAVKKGQGRIQGPVAVSSSILVETGDEDGAMVRFVGDVCSKRISLSRCFIYGNVIGSDVQLHDCVVLGVIRGATRIRMTDVLCFTFMGEDVELGGKVSLLNPSGMSSGRLAVNGQVFAVPFESWDAAEEEGPSGLIRLSEEDVRLLDCERVDGTSESLRVLSCYDRIVSAEDMADRMARNLVWMEGHLHEAIQGREHEDAVGRFERRMWTLARAEAEGANRD